MTDSGQGPVLVGIAASAGGLEACMTLLRALPAGCGGSFVLAQHMAPDHQSLLPDLLGRDMPLAVRELSGPTDPQPGCLYLPPPGSDVVLDQGRIQPVAPQAQGTAPKPSADRLFQSLAAGRGEDCIGIVLSGTGSDGTYGLLSIREAGGLTLAQDPATARYEAMPHSAIRSGGVDLVLTPQRIGAHLATLLCRPQAAIPLDLDRAEGGSGAELFALLQARQGADFRGYKDSTLTRRLQRRMVARDVADLGAYVALCREDAAELDALFRDLLISVTRFFRDPEAFAALAEQLDARVAQATRPGAPLRLWVPGCATGEEAWSLAILAAEALGGLHQLDRARLQVFATDIDDRALDLARQASYPASALAQIPPAYRRYFDMAGERITVGSRLRNVVTFSHHNVVQDPAFLSLDLVSLRNVLIYFDTGLQEQVLSRLHYALALRGLLFLGSAETTGPLDSQFAPLAPRHRIFAKRTGAVAPRAALPGPAQADPGFDALARAVVPQGFLCGADGRILKIYGDLAPFVALTDPFHGGMTLAALRGPLAGAATALLHLALHGGQRQTGLWKDLEGRDFDRVRLRAYPVAREAGPPLILFGVETGTRPRAEAAPLDRAAYLEHLETELARTRDRLASTSGQLRSTGETLQTLIEALQVANEDLQSANQELETSNEELQSTNEELITVNEELILKSAELQRMTAELDGLVRELPTETMMLGPDLMIRHASERAIRTFRLRRDSAGFGHLTQCHMPPGLPALAAICTQALREGTPQQHQYEDRDQLYTVAVTPLVAADDPPVGLTVVLSVAEMRYDRMLSQAIRSFGPIGIWQVEIGKGTVDWSEETFVIHGMQPSGAPVPVETAVAMFHEDDRLMVRQLAQAAIADDRDNKFHFFARLRRIDGRIIVVESAGAIIRDEAGRGVGLVGVVRDCTRHRSEDILLRQLNSLLALEGSGFWSYTFTSGLSYFSPLACAHLGLDVETAPQLEEILARIDPQDRAHCRWLLTEAPCGTPLAAELSAGSRRFRLSLYGSPDSSQRFGLLTAIPDLAQRPEDV